MKAPLYIVFLWHMHQPDYRDPIKAEYALPWTYLHAVKDYFDMAAVIEDVPGARAVFNFVPSLLEQLEEYAGGTANDLFLRLGMKDPSEMSEDERLFLLENFFSANRQRMIEPHRRYLDLLCRAGDGDQGKRKERLRSFSNQDLLDLQVCFFLAWTGEVARQRNPFYRELLQKGQDYSEEDKKLLFAAHRELIREIIPLYRRLQEQGDIELSVTPYFHPILPLLCDMKMALTAMPRANLPAARFRHPEDARSQVSEAITYYRELFGTSPAGMWPSEGSVSDEALGIIAECGIRWGATDEEVLAKSIGGLGEGKSRLYHPYGFRRPEGTVNIFFRDHTLSDLIGFTYSQWDADKGVADFCTRVASIRDRIGSGVISVILDGENAWEYYPANGYDFLVKLYRALRDMPGIRLATFSEVLDQLPVEQEISHIHPGSWINANYGIWVGHPEENLAWDYLERAREAAITASPDVAEVLAGRSPISKLSGTLHAVVKSLFAAEGSDWFWWYGDDHFSPHSDRFDLLFRRHLMNIYRLLKLDTPRELYEPIKKKMPAGLVREPAAFISPTINGQVDDYFEWLAAGLYDLTRQSSAMHAAESLMQSVFYGFDRINLYVRFDGSKSLDNFLTDGDSFALHLILEREFRLVMDINREKGMLFLKGNDRWEETGFMCMWKIGRVCEIQIPLEALNPVPGNVICTFAILFRNGDEIGRWPADAPLLLAYKGPDLEAENWLI